jgi:hypothetical protein
MVRCRLANHLQVIGYASILHSVSGRPSRSGLFPNQLRSFHRLICALGKVYLDQVASLYPEHFVVAVEAVKSQVSGGAETTYALSTRPYQGHIRMVSSL